jgi:hypothetical protein
VACRLRGGLTVAGRQPAGPGRGKGTPPGFGRCGRNGKTMARKPEAA